jgi:hypothetical protein
VPACFAKHPDFGDAGFQRLGGGAVADFIAEPLRQVEDGVIGIEGGADQAADQRPLILIARIHELRRFKIAPRCARQPSFGERDAAHDLRPGNLARYKLRHRKTPCPRISLETLLDVVKIFNMPTAFSGG